MVSSFWIVGRILAEISENWLKNLTAVYFSGKLKSKRKLPERKGRISMDFQKLVEFRNTHNPYAKKEGIVVEEIRAGYARVTKTVQADDINPAGLAHGGIYFALADTAAGAASAPHGYFAVTVNANYNYLRAVKPGDTLIAEGTECKTGKTICVYDVRVTDQTGTLIGTGSFTYYLLDRKIEL